jgi:ABC-2 type transport system ATP-binding protein
VDRDGPEPVAVRFEQASKRFGAKTALGRLSLEVKCGEVFALVGPNGAGKTTAIGLLTGLLTPTEGRVFGFGIDLAADPLALKRRLGFVPDRPWLWPRWTPRETLRFTGAVFGMGGTPLEERIEKELAAFSLTGAADQRSETLSHGTRQKTALAQAFLHDPDLFILDEPMVGLDPSAQRNLALRLRERTGQGASVLMTTHHLALAEEIADTVGVLHEGRLLAQGDPRRLDAGTGEVGLLSRVFFHLTESE